MPDFRKAIANITGRDFTIAVIFCAIGIVIGALAS